MDYQLDYLDRELLDELSKNARIPYTQLASKFKVSNSLIHQRVNKLKDQGILGTAAFALDPKALGYRTTAYLLITLDHSMIELEKLMEDLKKIPELVECANIAGPYDLLVKIHAKDNSHLRVIIYEQIDPIPGVKGTNTLMAFEVAFSRGISPLETRRDKRS